MDRLCRSSVLAGIAWAVLAGVLPATARPAARRSVVLEVAVADHPTGDWRADALTQALTADLADDRLAPRPPPACG